METINKIKKFIGSTKEKIDEKKKEKEKKIEIDIEKIKKEAIEIAEQNLYTQLNLSNLFEEDDEQQGLMKFMPLATFIISVLTLVIILFKK